MNILIITINNCEGLPQLIRMSNVLAGESGIIGWCALTEHNVDVTTAGVDQVYRYLKKSGRPWEAWQVREVIREVMALRDFSVILIENSQTGAAAGAGMACEMNGEMVANITGAHLESSGLAVIKPVYSSNINAVYRITKYPCFITIRDAVKSDVTHLLRKSAAVIEKTYSGSDSKQIIYETDEKMELHTLRDATRVVVAGRGVRNPHDLQIIEMFAERIDAVIGGSRPLIMNGLLPTERMIGQSGRIIAPDLCVAVGVSGATPLAVGIVQAKTIIAINQDQEAPIFKCADYGIAADYHEVLTSLNLKLIE